MALDAQAQQVIAQMQQQLQAQAQLAAAVAAASVAAPIIAGGGRPVVKPKPPSTFTAAGKVGELDQWEREMRYQFAAYGAPLSTDAARIAFRCLLSGRRAAAVVGREPRAPAGGHLGRIRGAVARTLPSRPCS